MSDDWETLTSLGRTWTARAGLSQESGDDLVQDALLVVATKDPAPDNPRGYFLGVLRRLSMKYFRSRYLRSGVVLRSDSGAGELGVAPSVAIERRLDLSRALGQLPAFLSGVFFRSELHGQSADEIARQERIDRKEVYQRKRRAVRALRNRLR